MSHPTAKGVSRGTFCEWETQVPKPTSVSLPEALEIGDFAFLKCSNLATVYLPKVTTIGDAVFQDTALTSLTVSALSTSYVNGLVTI